MAEPTWPEMVAEFMQQVTTEQAAAVEQACEMALTSGIHGVAVYRWIEDRPEGPTMCLEAGPDPSVSYGFIHWHDEKPKGA